MHFRILKMIATSSFLTALECTKFVFDRGPRWGSLQRSARPPSWFKGDPASRGRGREERGQGRTPNANSWIYPWALTCLERLVGWRLVLKVL